LVPIKQNVMTRIEFSDSERLTKHHEKAHKKSKEKYRVCVTEFNYLEDLRKPKKQVYPEMNGIPTCQD
jgi:hypothetical protein